jgi:hypothetical protein
MFGRFAATIDYLAIWADGDSTPDCNDNTKGSRRNNFTFLSADASCLAALRKLEISRYSCTFAPCQAGASTRKNKNLFLREL